MRRYRGLLLLAAIAVIFTVTTMLLPRTQQEQQRDHSIVRANMWGTKALAELHRQHGLKIEPWKRRMTALNREQRMLFVLNPAEQVSHEELRKLQTWVRNGGVLVVGVAMDQVGEEWERYDAQVLGAVGLVAERKTVPKGLVAVQGTDPVLREVRQLAVPSPYRLRVGAEKRLETLFKDLDTKGPPGKTPKAPPIPSPPWRWETVLADQYGPIIMRSRPGRGLVYALSDAGVFSNTNLSTADDVILASNLLFDHARPTAYFNEYVHGLKDKESKEEGELDSSRAWIATLLAALALALFLFTRGSRFGKPVPLLSPPRRSAMEFVDALGELYRRAEARGAVAEIMLQSFRRRLAASAGVAPDLPAGALAEAVGRRKPALQGPVAALLERLARATEQQPDERELLALGRLVATYEEALRNGR